MGPPGSLLGPLGASWEPPGTSWGLLGTSWGLLGPPGSLLLPLGASWAPPGPSWGLVGTSWGLLGPPGNILGPLGASLWLFGPPGISWGFVGPPGASWDPLGPPWSYRLGPPTCMLDPLRPLRRSWDLKLRGTWARCSLFPRLLFSFCQKLRAGGDREAHSISADIAETAKLFHTPCRLFGRADSIAPRIPPDQPLRPLAVESLRGFVSLSCGEFHRRGDSLKSQSKRNLKIKAELRDQRSKKVPKREPNKQRLPRTLLLEPAWKEKDTPWSKSCGASWVDNGSKQRARKATPTSRMALGTGMEAKCNNMEQKAKKYCFY